MENPKKKEKNPEPAKENPKSESKKVPNQTNPQNVPASKPQTSFFASCFTVFLLIFLPLIGIIVMWVGTNWSKTAKWILTAIFIILIAGQVILGLLVIRSLNNARGKVKDLEAQVKLRTISFGLESYVDQNKGKYIVAKSYNEAIEKLVSTSALTAKPGNIQGQFQYIYKYCSSNGKDYKLEVNQQSGKTPFSIGGDSCIPMP